MEKVVRLSEQEKDPRDLSQDRGWGAGGCGNRVLLRTDGVRWTSTRVGWFS